jgi:hypothetical protein
MDLLIIEESTLVLRDGGRQHNLEPPFYDLGDDLVNNVA